MPSFKTLFLAFVFAMLIASGAGAQSFIEKSLVAKSRLHNSIWTRHDQTSTIRVDHSAWNRFLAKYLVQDAQGVNRIRYASVNTKDATNLSEYLNALQAVDVTSLNRNEQYAFWLNLYNVTVVRTVLENLPIASILEIKSNPLDLKGPFNDALVRVNGFEITLDTIESGIVRPIWNDPRLHYAFNCGAVSCPNLMEEAFQSDSLDEQLERAARRFINDPRGARSEGREVILSKIYFWYSEDFGGSNASLKAHLLKYAEPGTANLLKTHTKRFKYDYDWALNIAK